jgi:hypothetical protein
MMDIQGEISRFPEPGDGNTAQSITPNTLHKTLLEIAHQSLSIPSSYYDNNAEVNRCKNDRGNNERKEERKTTLSPFIIKFEQQPSKSALQLQKELFAFWKSSSTSFNPNRLNVLARFGFESRLQIHAQDIESYDTLVAVNWPTQLDSKSLTVHPPVRVPPHHSIVIRDVPLSWQLPEIQSEIEEQYEIGSVRNIVRLYGRNGNAIPSVRLDASSSSFIATLLKDGYIKIGYSRHIVKEYRLPIRISPPCHNCHELGHFARNCKNSKRCGRCNQQHDGECQNDIKCASCGGQHFSGQSACPIVQRLRADKRQQRPPLPSTTRSYVAAANRLQPSSAKPQSSTSGVPSELQAQLTSINKKLDEVKNTFVDLSEKLSTKVGQLEDRVVNMEESIDVIFSRINYARDMAKIKHMYTKKSIETVLLPVITDIGKTIAGISRSQVSKKEIETICNDAQDALNDLDEEKDKAINGLESKYPLLKFR